MVYAAIWFLLYGICGLVAVPHSALVLAIMALIVAGMIILVGR